MNTVCRTVKKLRTHRGFTLSEMLVAVAILGLLSTAVAVGVPAVMRVYRQVTVHSEASVLCATISTALADELRQAVSPEADGSFYHEGFGGKVAVRSDGGRVYLGGHALLSNAAYSDAAYSSTAYTGGLGAMVQVGYSGAVFEVTVTVYRQEDASDALAAAHFLIEPLNP